MKTRNKLLPLVGITALTSISAPVIASCACANVNQHVWYSPKIDKKRYTNSEFKALFILVLDRDDYKASDLTIKLHSEYEDILAIDSVKVNHETVEVIVTVLDTSIDKELPFNLSVTTKDWSEDVNDLAIIAASKTLFINAEGPASIYVNQTSTYTATVTNKKGTEVQEAVEWSIVQGEDLISFKEQSDKMYSIFANKPGDVILRATIISQPAKYVDVNVNVSYSAATSIKVTGAASLHKNDVEVYKAQVLPETAEPRVASWSIEPTDAAVITSYDDTQCTVKCLSEDPTATFKVVAAPVSGTGGYAEVSVLNPYVETITVTPAKQTIWCNDDPLEYTADATPTTCIKDFDWSVDQTSVATITRKTPTTATLTPKANSYGKINVIAKATDGSEKTGSTELTVQLPATSFTITGASTTIRPDADGKATASFGLGTVSPEHSTVIGDPYNWKVDSKTSGCGTVTIDENGNLSVTGATDAGNIKISCDLQSKTTLHATLGITLLSPMAKSIEVTGIDSGVWTDDKEASLTYTVTPTLSTADVDLKWSVTDTDGNPIDGVSIEAKTNKTAVLKLDKEKVTAAETNAIVKAVDQISGEDDALPIKIWGLAKGLTIAQVTPGTELRALEDPVQYTYSVASGKYDSTTLKWYTDDKNIAEFSSDGKLTCHKAGTTNIYASIQTHDTTIKSEKVSITVLQPYVSSIAIDGASLLWLDDNKDTRTYKATTYPGEAATGVAWSISEGNAATIDQSGVLTIDESKVATSAKIKIKATATDKTTGTPASKEKEVEIKRQATRVSLTSNDTWIYAKNTEQYTAKAYYGDTEEYPITEGTMVFYLDDTDSNYATLDSSSGLLKGTKKTADLETDSITVRAKFTQTGREDRPIEGTKTLKIDAPLASTITIEGPDTIPYDSTHAIPVEYKAIFDDGAEDTVTWSIDDTSKATLSSTTTNPTNLYTQDSGKIILTATTSGSTPKTISKEITITTSWTDIFTYDEEKKLVTGFKDFDATQIGDYVSDTKTLAFPTDAGITGIAEGAFDNLISESATKGTLLKDAGVESIVIPSNITSIGKNALSNNDLITNKVTISGAAQIGEKAFYKSSLKELEALSVIDNGDTPAIGASAFEDCDSLATINLGNGATTQTIGDSAFAKIGATTVNLTANPGVIGASAFAETSGLIWSNIDNEVNNLTNLQSIGASAFQNTKLVTEGKSLVVNDVMAKAEIASSAFYNCLIQGIVLPAQTVESMYKYWNHSIFANCPNLKLIDLSKWTLGIPENLSGINNLFYFAGYATLTSENKGTWYYPSTLTEDVFKTWISSQIGEDHLEDCWQSGTK